MSNAYFDPWDMLNNFCFHVYAKKSLFLGENGNGFFYLPLILTTPVTLAFIELVLMSTTSSDLNNCLNGITPGF